LSTLYVTTNGAKVTKDSISGDVTIEIPLSIPGSQTAFPATTVIPYAQWIELVADIATPRDAMATKALRRRLIEELHG
jgi:hypothetical protein